MDTVTSNSTLSSNQNSNAVQKRMCQRAAPQSIVSYLAFVIFVLSLSFFVQTVDAQVTSAEYYVVNAGDSWLFEVTANGDVRDAVSVIPADTTLINGVATTAVEFSDGSRFFVTVDAQGVKIHRIVQPSAVELQPGVFVDVIITLAPPADIVGPVVDAGATVSNSGTATVDLGLGPPDTVSYDSQSTFVGIESITVPAGTFSDTMRVTPSLTLSGTLGGQPFSQVLSFEQWAARSLGLIKIIQDVDGLVQTNDLVSANRIPSSVPLASSLLPTSRSVQTGTPATVFATIINAGTETATDCRIAPVNFLPVAFSYQTTDPATNALTGTPDTPVDIDPNNGLQTFVLSLTPSAAISPADVEFAFACTNSAFAANFPGVNSLLLSASDTPVPDIVALSATPTGDGIVALAGDTGANAFAVATVNVGSLDTITASADTGTATNLPVTLSICESDPATGACLAAPAPSVTTTIAAGATPTFSVFVTGTGTVPFDPAANRIFVRFNDAGGVTRGSTSVAVQTL